MHYRTEIVGKTVGETETSRTWKGWLIWKGLDMPVLNAKSLRAKDARRLQSVVGSMRWPSVITGDSRLICRAIGLIGCTRVLASVLMKMSLSLRTLSGGVDGMIDDGDRQPQIPMIDI